MNVRPPETPLSVCIDAAERLLTELEEHRSRMRGIFERCFSAEQRREQ